MPRNVGSVVNSINELVAELGLEKLSAADDPGTSHPAKQEDGKSQIQAATEGARSAENVKDTKDEVTGQSVSEANAGDAKKEPGKSNTANITTATFVGEDPKVEKGYVSSVTDPGTTHPAAATSKTAEELAKCATDILAEVQKLAETTVKTAAEAREKMASMVEAAADKKDAAVDEHVTEYLRGYTKSAALIGELTADMLDGIAAGLAEQQTKKAEGDMIPAEAMGADAGAEAGAAAGGADEEAAALAQAAQQIAAELGITPEEVLEAAEAELAGGAAPAEGGDEAAEAAQAAQGMEAQASVKEAELVELRKKAEAYDKLVAEQLAKEAEQRQASVVSAAVAGALQKWASEHAEAKK